MTDQEAVDRLTRILRDLLGNDAIVLTMDTTRAEVPNWDSFGYVSFIAIVEMELGVKFRVADVESFASVGDIVRRIQSLLKK